jgi:signal transduction histidine kinase
MPLAAPDLLGLVERVQAWAREHHQIVDLLFACVATALAIADVAGLEPSNGNRELDGIGVAIIVVGGGALIWRRRASVVVLSVVFAALMVFYVRDYGSFMSIVGLIAMYSVAAHAPDRRLAWTVLTLGSVGLLVVASFSILDEADGYNYANLANTTMYIVVLSVAGGVVRNRQRLFADTQRRAEHAEHDRLAEAERAVQRERIRIAREMHDVVAHGMSVITVQAAAAEAVVFTDAEAAAGALRQIRLTGRESLDELRRMLSVLRGDEGDLSEFEPQPRLCDISKLVSHCIDAGIPTEFAIAGPERELSPGIGLAAYRIVQEALTNVMKHAGESAEASVDLTYTGRALKIEVTDTGRGAVTSLTTTGGGNGLVGMRERVEAYQGVLNAGPVAGGGYRVSATLPIDKASDRPAVVAEPTRTEVRS